MLNCFFGIGIAVSILDEKFEYGSVIRRYVAGVGRRI